MSRPPYKVRHIAGRDRLDTGRLVIGIAHQTPPASMGSEAERVSRALAPPMSHVVGMHGAMNPLHWQRRKTHRSFAERLLVVPAVRSLFASLRRAARRLRRSS